MQGAAYLCRGHAAFVGQLAGRPNRVTSQRVSVFLAGSQLLDAASETVRRLVSTGALVQAETVGCHGCRTNAAWQDEPSAVIETTAGAAPPATSRTVWTLQRHAQEVDS